MNEEKKRLFDLILDNVPGKLPKGTIITIKIMLFAVLIMVIMIDMVIIPVIIVLYQLR